VDISVAPATVYDLTYIDHLQRKNAEELAFYPRAAFEREVLNARIILARVNGDPAGYLYHGAFGPICKIHQACIEYDLRGQLYGASLVRWFTSLARVANCSSVTLRCGSDIDANGFWKAMGFHCEAVTPGGVRRMRDINCWRMNIQDQLFEFPIVEPSNREQDASAWRKRSVNLGSQFLRGKALKDYRKIITGEDK
jgi:hypothetical protein